MSASNWGICPKCADAQKKAREKLELIAADGYGKVSEQEYLNAKNEVDKEIRLNSNLIEDYEIYVLEDGEFFVSYRCSCEKCGFEFSFKHEEQAWRSND